MIVQTEAVALRSISFRENSRIVSLYTRERGRVDCMARGVSGKKGRSKLVYFQPLTLLQTTIYFRPNRDLQTLTEQSFSRIYRELHADPVKAAYAALLAELLQKLLRAEEPDEKLFNMLVYALTTMDALERGLFGFFVKTLLELSAFQGFYPLAGELDENLPVYFDPKEGRLENVAFEPPLPGKYIYALMRAPYGEAANAAVPKSARLAITETLLRYFQYHQEGFGELKSWPVFQALFAD